MKPTREQLVNAMAEAIARMEGFYLQRASPSVAQVNKNPGNLRSWGKMPISASGYAKFPTVEAGWAALRKQVTNNIWGMPRDMYPLRVSDPLTFKTFFAGQRQPDGVVRRGGYSGYAPAADKNHPAGYAKFVYIHCAQVLELPAEITLETPLRSICD